MTKTAPQLQPDETLIASFTPNRGTYIREHVMLAAIGSVAVSGILVWMGNPHAWTGIVGSVLAIGARGAYAMSEQLGMVWHLTDRRLIGPSGTSLTLGNVQEARRIFSAVQIVTRTGDKYMLKYLGDTQTAEKQILEARAARMEANA